MSMYGLDPTEVTTSQKEVLGTIKIQPATGASAESFEEAGPRWWRYVKAASALGAGEAAVIATTAVNYGAVDDAAGPVTKTRVAGITQNAIPLGSYGWVLCLGLCNIKDSGAGMSAGDSITSASGGIITMGAGTEEAVIGHAAATIGVSATGLGFISCL